jgi:glyoxylase-like metal-dependent hydrolase (beta-lactamase superfamily II)
MEVTRIEDGLWRWTAPHPDWRPADGGDDGWEADVASTFVETAAAIVLVDPLVPTDGEQASRFWRALDRDLDRVGAPPVVVLTAFWHARSARDVAARHPGTRVYAPDAQREEALQRVEVTAWYAPGDALPGRIEARPTADPGEAVLWLAAHATLVVADVVTGTTGGLRLCPAAWLPGGATLADLVESLRPLLDLPVARVLTAHGPPVLEDGAERLAEVLAAGPEG